MVIDNLPSELPRDASASFGNNLLEYVLPSLLGKGDPGTVQRATIARDDQLTEDYRYLQDFLNEARKPSY